jgi:hypothetical protein
VKKQPRAAVNPSSFMAHKPSWRFSNIRMRAPFGWDGISRVDMQGVVSRLASLETMTWSDILVTAKKHNHFCEVSALSKPAREIIEQDWQGADRVVSIRLTNTKRIWGVIERGICYLLWWDPAHEVFPSTYMDRFS